MILTLSATVGTGQVFCPADIAPCTCSSKGDGTVALNCGSTGISQEKTSDILNLFLQNGVSPLSEVDLEYNGFTSIPLQLSKFPQLRTLYLQQQAIRTVPSGAFPDSLRSLDLHLNLISSIAPGNLNGMVIDSLRSIYLLFIRVFKFSLF